VLGLGVEHAFLREIASSLAPDHETLSARIVETSRNLPVRNFYRDNGFVLGEDGTWRLRLVERKTAARQR
jgi:predicted enzyme involved in methoxymalonyl-ACP biosynthesis